MATFSSLPTERSNNVENSTEANANEPWSTSLLHQAQRVIAPIQTPVGSGTPVQEQLTGGFTATANSANATFAVLKATVLQQSFGHPLAYARVLMQIGYEPINPVHGRTILGKEAHFYPNIFRYLKFIYNRDGFLGLYRGFGCSLASKMICWYATTKVDEILGPVDPVVPDEKTKATWNTCIKKTLREVRCQSFGILVSHPFHVMAVRCMSQFIGGETDYSSYNISQNFHEIIRNEGVGGFFTGLLPRWLLEIMTIVISNVLIHMMKSQLPNQSEMVPLYEYMAALFAQTATYPLSVVTTVSAINRSGLQAAMINQTPLYANWQDAYRHLGKLDQLKRGSSFFNRVASGPVVIPTPSVRISKP